MHFLPLALLLPLPSHFLWINLVFFLIIYPISNLCTSFLSTFKAFLSSPHREIIVQLGYDSGHIANPFSPLFYPHRSEYPAPFI